MSDGFSWREYCRRCRITPLRSLLTPVMLILFLVVGSSCDRGSPRVDMDRVSAPGDASPQKKQKILRMAVSAMISPEATRHYYEDLLRLLARRMEREAVFVQRRTYAEVNLLVRNRDVDLAFVCSGPYTQGHDDFGMEILAVPVVHGAKVYHSYIIAHRDSNYSGFASLKDCKFAFTDPDSNTGCLVPTYMLSRRGQTPASFFRESFFSNSHDNSIKAVAEGLADGASVDSLIWEFLNVVDPSYTSRTKIIERSPPFGIPPIVVHPGLDPLLKRDLKKMFFTLHQDREASPLLAKLQIDRFEEGNDTMYDTVRDMRRWVSQRKGK